MPDAFDGLRLGAGIRLRWYRRGSSLLWDIELDEGERVTLRHPRASAISAAAAQGEVGDVELGFAEDACRCGR